MIAANSQKKPVVYLANPLGFSALTRPGLPLLIGILEPEFEVIEPFDLNADHGAQLDDVTEETKSLATLKRELHAINMEIGARNEQAIRTCDLVVAILDGTDTGVAAEVGCAFAYGKPVFGLRSDFRLAGDNLGSKINLQVEYFVEASGGVICTTLQELRDRLSQWKNSVNSPAGT